MSHVSDHYVGLAETTLFNGRVVRPEDTVHLRPPDTRECTSIEDRIYFQIDYDDEAEEHGEGPFKIKFMAEWECGRIMLYLEPDERGVYAEDYM